MRNLKTRIASVSVLAMLTVAAMSTIGLESASAGKRGQRAKGSAVNKLKVKGGGNHSAVVRGGDASANAECEINQNNVGVVGAPVATNACPVNATGGAQTITGPVTIGGPVLNDEAGITTPGGQYIKITPGIVQTNTASGNGGNGG